MEKLKVTLEDRPEDVELAQYKRMFEAACSALGRIGEALGVDPNEGGDEPILAAIEELKAAPTQAQPVKPLTDEELDAIWMQEIPIEATGTTWRRSIARAIEAKLKEQP